MHVPEKWQIDDQQQIFNFIEQHSFAALVSPSLDASHLPLLLDRENKRILGHFARNNSHCKVAESQALAIFSGAHDYISPTWYANSPAVPTWNYAAVHVHGQLTWLNDQQTAQMLEQLMAKYEPELLVNRQIVTAEYQQKLSRGIIGFALSIESIDAKAKLGQHRSNTDQQGVVKGLQQADTASANQLLALMKQLQLGMGD